LKVLNIGNNKLGDSAVDGLLFVLGESRLEELQIDFSRLTPPATQAIIKAIADRPMESCCLKKLSLSGNNMNTEGARAFAGLLARQGGCSLREIHVDQMNFGQAGKRDIAVSIATNPDCALDVITGLALGPLMVELGSPVELANFSNVQVLHYIRGMWAEHRMRGKPKRNTSSTTTVSDDNTMEEDTGSCDRSGVESNLSPKTVLANGGPDFPKKRPHEKHLGPPRGLSRNVSASDSSLRHSASSTELLAHLAADVHRSHIKRNLSQVSPSLLSENSDDGDYEPHDLSGSSHGPEDNDQTDSCGSDTSQPRAAAPPDTASRGTATTEQIDTVSKQLEHMFEVRCSLYPCCRVELI
jgi:hypothetical protein